MDLKVLGHIVRQMQEAMIQNSPGVQKMEVLLNQAKVELNRDLSKKGDRIKHEVQKTVEKITLEQEQKMEARLKALEKMHDNQLLTLNRRLEDLSKENSNLRGQLLDFSMKAAEKPTEIVINHPPPQMPPPTAPVINLAVSSKSPEIVPKDLPSS